MLNVCAGCPTSLSTPFLLFFILLLFLFPKTRPLHPGGTGRPAAAAVAVGPGRRRDGVISAHPSVPFGAGPRPSRSLHHLLPSPRPSVPSLHLPGALQVCEAAGHSATKYCCYIKCVCVFIMCLFFYRLTPRNCTLLTNQSMSESQPWLEMLVRIQEISRDLLGMWSLNKKYKSFWIFTAQPPCVVQI